MAENSKRGHGVLILKLIRRYISKTKGDMASVKRIGTAFHEEKAICIAPLFPLFTFIFVLLSERERSSCPGTFQSAGQRLVAAPAAERRGRSAGF